MGRNKHVCDEKCVLLVRERLAVACPPIWNSMRNEDQRIWLNQDHEYAYQFVHNSLSPTRKSQWAVIRFFRRLFPRKGFERSIGSRACPTCGR